MIHKEELSFTTASGAGSVNTKDLGGLVRQTMIYSATTTTTFNASIIDDKSRTIRSWVDVTQEVNDLTAFPVDGIYTISVSSASADEAFTVYLGIQEV